MIMRLRFLIFMVDQGGLVFLDGERVMHLLEVDSLVPSPLYGCSWDNCQVNDYPRNPVYIVDQHYVQEILLKKQPPMLTKVKNLDYRFAFVIIFTGAQEKENVSENLTQSSSQLKRCVEHKNAFSSVTSSDVSATSCVDVAREISTTVELEGFGSSTLKKKMTCDVQVSKGGLKKHKPCLSAFSLCTTRSCGCIPLSWSILFLLR